jgi:hypothetical protein
MEAALETTITNDHWIITVTEKAGDEFQIVGTFHIARGAKAAAATFSVPVGKLVVHLFPLGMPARTLEIEGPTAQVAIPIAGHTQNFAVEPIDGATNWSMSVAA